MRLKQLELYGYKSFASRTSFQFGEGITAVVGPNGSGKSNIADAIRWVMGEQSYRNLRAKTTEDMIFAGTRSRPRLGMAEVILTLDNADGWLPIAYSEVTVGRRAYRSGENEYLLNGNRVRYRDIVELLGVAGLARSTYTVIGQGMVDAALALRPEARRALFEEAAGIAPHLRKRDEALTRIHETERNLERVNDILSELRPRAGSLRRQAERAEEYLLLAQDLTELQRIWYGYQWQRSQRDLLRAEERLRDQQAYLEGQRTHLRGFVERQEILDRRLAEGRARLESLRNELAAHREEASGLRREVDVAAERIRLHEQQGTAIASEMQALASRRAILEQEVARAAQELAEQEAAATQDQDALAAARRELTAIENARRVLEKELSSQQSRLAQSAAAMAETRARLEQLGERRAQLESESAAGRHTVETLNGRLAASRAQIEEDAAHERALVAAQEAAAREGAAVEERLAALREETAGVEGEIARIRAEHDRLQTRQELLTRLRQELTGYLPGVREVLSAESRLTGVLGTVANLMTVPADLEPAIESALGNRLQNIVTERWDDAEAAIAFLKRTRAGWATFLPLDTVRPRQAMTAAPNADVVGVASELVHCDERIRPVVELLMGRILIVRDLPAARRQLQGRSGASLLVTLEGETVQPGGVLSGGARKNTSNLLAQEREWRELPARIAAVEADLEEAAARLRERQARGDELRRERAEAERQVSRLRLARDAARETANTHTQELREAERELEWQQARAAQSEKELGALAVREAGLGDSLKQAAAAQAETDLRLQDVRRRLAEIADGGLGQKVAELETRTAVAQRTVQSQRRLLASHNDNLADLGRQIDDKVAQRTAMERDASDARANAAQLAARAEAVGAEVTAATERLAPAQAALQQLEAERQAGDQEHARARQRLQEAEIENNRLSLDRDRVNDQQMTLAHEIEIDLGPIDLPTHVSHQLRLNMGDDVIELPHVESLPAGLGDEIRQMKSRLRRLGNVNADAPREYEQLLERQTFLQQQSADLRGAIASLHEIIQELDALIEHDFVDTIKRVDGFFGEYFRILFKGGSARLTLTDPENVSTSGVDILAHPPGKRPQNLSLLSGGERSLTAVALLFALLRANPVPFCFFDEVDAALDEANVGRFRDLLREHSQMTQFIVITHNRNTIEAATTIYGVSMSEQGVSQCMSLRLDADAQELALLGVAKD